MKSSTTPKRSPRGSLKQRSTNSEAGITLIEVLVVLAILPIIVGAIVAVTVTAMRNQTTTSARLGHSTDALVFSTYFNRDVQSASQITETALPAASTGPAICGTGGGSATLIAGFTEDFGATVISYWAQPNSDGGDRVIRTSCSNGVVQSNVTVANDITTSQIVSINCASEGALCAPQAGWVSATGVSGVTFSVSENVGTHEGALAYQLFAVPRIAPVAGVTGTTGVTGATGVTGTTGTTGTTGGSSVIQLLSSAKNARSIAGSSNTVQANGNIVVNSALSGSVSLTGSSNSISATSGSLEINGCSASQPNGGACSTGWVTNSGSKNTTTAPVSMPSALADPLASLGAPAIPTVNGKCTLSGSTYTCTPGLYSSVPAFNGSGQTINFQPGNYLFEGCTPLDIYGSSETVNFGSGTYLFGGGITVEGSSDKVTSGTGGVFFYVGDPNGKGNLGMDSSQAVFDGSSLSISLSPLTTGPDAGVLFYEDRADSSEVEIYGSANETSSYGGTIYAPSAEVLLHGSSNSMTVKSIVAGSLALAGSAGNVVVG